MRKGQKKDNTKYQSLTKELLESLYVVEGLSTVEIQRKLDIDRGTITRYMKKFGIDRGTSGEMGARKSIKYDTLDENYFNIIDTEEKAYILGFILGDGTISDRGVHIALAIEDYQILYDIAKCMKAEEYITVKKAKASNEQDKVHLPLRRKQLAIDLNLQGIPFPPKSLNEPFIKLKNDKLQWHFIRGMFDADGCIRVFKRGNHDKFKFTITAGQKFCEGFKSYLETWLGIMLPPKSSHKNNGSEVWVFELASKKIIHDIGIYMYDSCNIYLKRKKQKFDLIKE